jgi:hypothetical protein
LTLLLVLKRDRPAEEMFVLILIGLGLVLSLAVEFFAIKGDVGRMNTVFKFYLQIWMLWSISTAIAIRAVWQQLSTRRLFTTRQVWAVVLSVLIVACSVYPVVATRADLLRRQREDKAQALAPPPKPSFTTRAWDFAESTYGPKAAQYNGFTPRIGSVVSGSGFALGVRYRNTLLFDRRAGIELGAIGSYKLYYRVGARFDAPRLGGSPFFASLDAQALEYPQVDFFGIGTDTQEQNRTTYLYDEFRAGGRLGAEVLERVRISAGLSLVNPRVGGGRNPDYPSIETQFSETDAPGLASQPTFLMTTAFLDWNRVGDPEHARTGQRLQVTFTNAADRSDGSDSYRQLDIDARKFFPMFQGKRAVVATSFSIC